MSTPPNRGRVIRRVVWIVVGVVALWFVVAMVFVGLSALAARDAATELDAVRDDLSLESVLVGDGQTELEDAAATMDRAQSLVGNPLVAPAKFLPIIGRQVRSLDALTATSASLLDSGAAAVGSVSDDTAAVSDPTQRVAALDRMHAIAADLRTQVETADLGPSDGLVGPLAEARSKLAEAQSELLDGLTTAESVTEGLASFLSGGNYVVLMGNNAEMRAGQGMALDLAELRTDNGHLELGEITRASARNPEPGEIPVTPATEQLVANWGWLYPLDDWRNLGVTPRFDVSGPLAAQMWKADTGQDVDGVLLVDVEALRAVLAATGPVTVDGRTIDQANVISELLVQQYFNPDEDARRDEIAAIARAAFDALDRGGWDLGTLARQLRAAAAGRHLIAWSPKPEQQSAWVSASVAGELDDSSLLVGTVNRGGNKLDPFLAVDVALDVARDPGGEGSTVTATIALANNTPEGLTEFAGGPHPNVDAEYGEYVGVIAVSLPGTATAVTLAGGEYVAVDGPDGPTHVIGAWIRLTRGAQAELTLQFRVAADVDELQVVSSARIPAENWQVGADAATDAETFPIRW